SALHGAALIAGLVPFIVIFGTLYLVQEERTRVDLPELKNAFRGLLAAFRSRRLWVVGLYLFFHHFSPGVSTPLYYHMTDTLHFSQSYIGLLGSIGSAGSIGALLHRWYLAGMTSKRLLQLSILVGTVTTASFLLLLTR